MVTLVRPEAVVPERVEERQRSFEPLYLLVASAVLVVAEAIAARVPICPSYPS